MALQVHGHRVEGDIARASSVTSQHTACGTLAYAASRAPPLSRMPDDNGNSKTASDHGQRHYTQPHSKT